MTHTPANPSVYIGIDVGSTTVKCVAVDPSTLNILWQSYQRHETKQAEKVFDMLEAIEQQFGHLEGAVGAYITGSGAAPLSEPIGARFVQEVNAVTLAVEKRHPDVSSVIELGGQDAKIILFKTHPQTGERQIITSMNDKCASGTGATIDKCVLKVGLAKETLGDLAFNSEKLHHVAAKCGVFAETDIVNLIKAGIPADEVMNSLADAIVMQNLSVLTRGNTLQANVLLLGGPNTYLPFLQDCWRLRIPQTWADRGYTPPQRPLDELIKIPRDAQYYAAFGAVVFGSQESRGEYVYQGSEGLRRFIRDGRKAKLAECAGPALVTNEQERQVFETTYRIPPFTPPLYPTGCTIAAYLGVDGGSTSSKAILMDKDGRLIKKEYQLSGGNPIQDVKDMLRRLYDWSQAQQCRLEILGFGATGYAADVLDKAVQSDANIVETVAHMMSAKKSCGDDVDVICDIGGQDIKVLFLQNGTIKNFRLSNQCSAGNGMLLQAMADQFGIDVKSYADVAFQAGLAPKFSYGCAVFLDSDRVNFQKEGFSRDELFAGLAMVLPKNVWQYVVQIPRMAQLGRKFVLQGGTQYNLAAVKAQVDYIQKRVPDAEVIVHPHCGEAGAIGAALEAKRVVERQGYSRFIGLEATMGLQYTTRTDETTRCHFCENHCSRTFIDTRTPKGDVSRYIAGFSCEKGTVESKQAVIALNKERKRLKSLYPNLVDYEATYAFRSVYKPQPMPDAGSLWRTEQIRHGLFGSRRRWVERGFQRSDDARHRANLRIGIPRVLNIYSLAPFMRAYLETLGIKPGNVVFSDQTSEELWLEGGKFGAIDPCYPSKVALAHIHNLLTVKQRHKPLHAIWFPCVTHLPTFVSHTVSATTCPIVAGAPEVASAAFTKEKDHFTDSGIEFIKQALDFTSPTILRKQLFSAFAKCLNISRDENDFACEQGFKALTLFEEEMQRRGMELLTQAEQQQSVVLLMLGRPYHNDPGLNHEILDEFQALGYPVLSIRSIPKDPAYLNRFFQSDLAAGSIQNSLDINDVWPENYSTNSVQKVWAAKFAARHPNVAVIDFSSFKCGHDAPTYGLIDKIIEHGQTPYAALHDLDANKPGGSIKIRVKTYAYALSLYQESLQDQAAVLSELDKLMMSKRRELMGSWLKKNTEQFQQIHQRHDLAGAFDAYVLDSERTTSSSEHTTSSSEHTTSSSEQKSSGVSVQFAKNPLKVRDAMVKLQYEQLKESSEDEHRATG